MKLTTLLLTLVTSFTINATECNKLVLPNNFKLVEKILTLSGGIAVKSTDRSTNLAFLNKKILSFKDTYVLRTVDKNIIATASQRWFSWGLHLDIKDCNGIKLGQVKMQNFISNIISADSYAVYTIYDNNDNAVAQSERVTVLSTKYNFYTLDNKTLVASLNRSFIGGIFNDVWDVQIHYSQLIDSKVILFMAAFKSLHDNKEAEESNRTKSDK